MKSPNRDRDSSDLIRDPEEIFKLYLQYRGASGAGHHQNVRLSESRICKILRDSGYPLMHATYPSIEDWKNFANFWQPPLMDNPLEDGIFSHGIILRTKLWKRDLDSKKAAITRWFEQDADDTSMGSLRMVHPFILFNLANNLDFAVMLREGSGNFYVMRSIPPEAYTENYSSRQGLKPAFQVYENQTYGTHIRCLDTKYSQCKKKLEQDFKCHIGINGGGKYSISYLVDARFITKTQGLEIISNELRKIIA